MWSTMLLMHDGRVEFDGLMIETDPLTTEKRSFDATLPVLAEEQPVTLRFARSYLEAAFDEAHGSLDFLDVGTGCGVYALWVAKHFGVRRVVAIDRNLHAVQQATQNAVRNDFSIEFRQEHYDIGTAEDGSVKAICLSPPYQPYPTVLGANIPPHARGGFDGQCSFKAQLAIANTHLAHDGVIMFNMMCLGNKKGPAYLSYISFLIGGAPEIIYTNLLPPIKSRDFLFGVYTDNAKGFIDATARTWPLMYYTAGIILRNGRGTVLCERNEFGLGLELWARRIQQHKIMAAPALRQQEEQCRSG